MEKHLDRVEYNVVNLTFYHKTIISILMTRDQSPLIDIPTFISRPILNMVSEMSGGGHSFLKQLCTAIQDLDLSSDEQNHFASLLTLIDSLISASPDNLQKIWLGQLHSFDNRTLFQGVAEIISVGRLVKDGWSIQECNEHGIRLNHPVSGQVDLLVLSLILDRDLEEERRLQHRLVDQLNALQSPYRLGLTIRTPLSPHIDIPKIVSMTKKWLSKAHSKIDQKQRRVGYMKDALCHIDFRVIGPKEHPSESTVYLVTPPVLGQRLQRNISQMMSQSIETLRRHRTQGKDVPVLLSIVSNQSMHISERAWTDLLYGLSHEQSQGNTVLDTRHFGGWFQDPFRTFVGGVLCAEHTLNPRREEDCFNYIAFANPWCEFPTIQSALPLPTYRYSRIEPTEYASPFSKASWVLKKT